eukprot:1901838-Amphidinium_carterae.1
MRQIANSDIATNTASNNQRLELVARVSSLVGSSCRHVDFCGLSQSAGLHHAQVCSQDSREIFIAMIGFLGA